MLHAPDSRTRLTEIDAEVAANTGPDSFIPFPFHAVMTLALESNRVIVLRLTKIAGGVVEAVNETHLMVSETIGAAAEAARTIMTGGTAMAVIARYQERVSANARRVSHR